MNFRQEEITINEYKSYTHYNDDDIKWEGLNYFKTILNDEVVCVRKIRIKDCEYQPLLTYVLKDHRRLAKQILEYNIQESLKDYNVVIYNIKQRVLDILLIKPKFEYIIEHIIEIDEKITNVTINK